MTNMRAMIRMIISVTRGNECVGEDNINSDETRI